MKLNAAQHFMTQNELIDNLQITSKSMVQIQDVKVEKSTVQKIGKILTIGISIALITYQLYEMYNRIENTPNKKS
jgi:hypothetical protein